MLPLTVWPLLFVRMNRARTADRFRYLGEVQGPDSPGVRAPRSSRCSPGARLAEEGPGWCLTSLTNALSSGIRDLTRLEKSDLSRDFFSCLDFVGDRGDFFIFFDFR